MYSWDPPLACSCVHVSKVLPLMGNRSALCSAYPAEAATLAQLNLRLIVRCGSPVSCVQDSVLCPRPDVARVLESEQAFVSEESFSVVTGAEPLNFSCVVLTLDPQSDSCEKEGSFSSFGGFASSIFFQVVADHPSSATMGIQSRAPHLILASREFRAEELMGLNLDGLQPVERLVPLAWGAPVAAAACSPGLVEFIAVHLQHLPAIQVQITLSTSRCSRSLQPMRGAASACFSSNGSTSQHSSSPLADRLSICAFVRYDSAAMLSADAPPQMQFGALLRIRACWVALPVVQDSNLCPGAVPLPQSLFPLSMDDAFVTGVRIRSGLSADPTSTVVAIGELDVVQVCRALARTAGIGSVDLTFPLPQVSRCTKHNSPNGMLRDQLGRFSLVLRIASVARFASACVERSTPEFLSGLNNYFPRAVLRWNVLACTLWPWHEHAAPSNPAGCNPVDVFRAHCHILLVLAQCQLQREQELRGGGSLDGGVGYLSPRSDVVLSSFLPQPIGIAPYPVLMECILLTRFWGRANVSLFQAPSPPIKRVRPPPSLTDSAGDNWLLRQRVTVCDAHPALSPAYVDFAFMKVQVNIECLLMWRTPLFVSVSVSALVMALAGFASAVSCVALSVLVLMAWSRLEPQHPIPNSTTSFAQVLVNGVHRFTTSSASMQLPTVAASTGSSPTTAAVQQQQRLIEDAILTMRAVVILGLVLQRFNGLLLAAPVRPESTESGQLFIACVAASCATLVLLPWLVGCALASFVEWLLLSTVIASFVFHHRRLVPIRRLFTFFWTQSGVLPTTT